MDGLYNGKPYEQMDDLGGKPNIFGNTHISPLKMMGKCPHEKGTHFKRKIATSNHPCSRDILVFSFKRVFCQIYDFIMSVCLWYTCASWCLLTSTASHTQNKKTHNLHVLRLFQKQTSLEVWRLLILKQTVQHLSQLRSWFLAVLQTKWQQKKLYWINPIGC